MRNKRLKEKEVYATWSNAARMAAVASEMPDMEVHADTHFIGVDGDEARLEELVKEEVLSVNEWDDEDFSDEDEEDSN